MQYLYLRLALADSLKSFRLRRNIILSITLVGAIFRATACEAGEEALRFGSFLGIIVGNTLL